MLDAIAWCATRESLLDGKRGQEQQGCECDREPNARRSCRHDTGSSILDALTGWAESAVAMAVRHRPFIVPSHSGDRAALIRRAARDARGTPRPPCRVCRPSVRRRRRHSFACESARSGNLRQSGSHVRAHPWRRGRSLFPPSARQLESAVAISNFIHIPHHFGHGDPIVRMIVIRAPSPYRTIGPEDVGIVEYDNFAVTFAVGWALSPIRSAIT